MDIKTTKRTLRGLPPKHSVLLEAGHGLGKSEIVAQTASEMSVALGKPFGFIDIRLGQYEVGDLIGIPRAREAYTITNKVYKAGKLVEDQVVATNVTVHDLPLWFPRDPESYGFMFFDELNRGSRDTQQWAMQVVLDYKSNFVDVPKNWRVVAACNDDQDVYSILGLDPALYDRFHVIKFRPTVKEWLDYADTTGVHDAVVKYIRKFSSDLDCPEKVESGKRYPSRRSWVKLSNTLKYMAENKDNPLDDLDYLLLLSKGYVGESVAVNFSEFIRKEYKVYTGAEILNNFPKLKADFEKMIATDFTFYNKEIVRHIKKEEIKLSKKQGGNLFEYLKIVPREVATGFWSEFCGECKSEATKWYKGDQEIQEYITNLLSRSASLAA